MVWKSFVAGISRSHGTFGFDAYRDDRRFPRLGMQRALDSRFAIGTTIVSMVDRDRARLDAARTDAPLRGRSTYVVAFLGLAVPGIVNELSAGSCYSATGGAKATRC